MEVRDAEVQRQAEKTNLHEAYQAWKRKHGIKRVERDTLEWIRMMQATNADHDRFEREKAVERNARRRLATAVDRYRKGG
jgi:hypothetical protein